MGFPLVVRAIRLSMEAIDPRLEAAAHARRGPWRVFFTVTLPLAWPGLVTGALLGFARALGEFGATITFVSNIPGETRTLPLAIYGATQMPGGDAAGAAAIDHLGRDRVRGARHFEWLVRRRRRGAAGA